MFQRFKEMSIVEIVRASKTQKRKSTLIERTDIENRKIVYCLVGRVFIPHHDELTDFQNKKINDWLSLSLIHDHSRRLTMRQVEVKFNHRSQREDFFINADSRSFSLTHVVGDFLLTRVSLRVIWELQIGDFLLTRVFLRVIWEFQIGDFLLTRVFLRVIWKLQIGDFL